MKRYRQNCLPSASEGSEVSAGKPARVLKVVVSCINNDFFWVESFRRSSCMLIEQKPENPIIKDIWSIPS